ncbi:MAG: endonuclease/exonuclease/phosphatase family protein [Bacteroidales bacterium]|nr:endonuclease/exonuclease/phosphatase family protein [Bacteroidales bacterium]
MKVFFKGLTYLILVVSIIFAVFLIYSTLTDYRPEAIENVSLDINVDHKIDTTELSFISWNMGYAGLGQEKDFFYDEGKGVRPSDDENTLYFKNISEFVLQNDSIDFFLLQEVDENSKRTYYRNQKELLTNLLEDRNAAYIKNYDVGFVPQPLSDPLGKVCAGMVSLSKFAPIEAKRYALPEVYSWPMRIFMLDRAFIYTAYQLPNGKKLIVINIHNSAYVHDDIQRRKELDVIKSLATTEYQKGNYVIIGGDWNMNPPDFSRFMIDKKYNAIDNEFKLSKNLFDKEWQWIYDPGYPTNRSLEQPFVMGENTTHIIDFFLLSPNVEALKVQTLSQDFVYSDHEPVYMKIKIIE